MSYGASFTTPAQYPGTVALTQAGTVSGGLALLIIRWRHFDPTQFGYCRSWLADCYGNDPYLLSTTTFSIKNSFSISAYVDIGTAMNGTFLPNTQAGIAIVDATRNFIVFYCMSFD